MLSNDLPAYGRADLVSRIVERIREAGRITFAEFMEMALYYPGLGYYTSPGPKIGAGGDFYTSPDVDPLFGEMWACQFAEAMPQITAGAGAILEFGAGKGTLCRDILRCLERGYPDVYGELVYWIVERSPALRADQESRLAGYAAAGKVRWLEAWPPSRLSPDLVGIAFLNEVLDAFPVHRVVRRGGRLQEVYVTIQRGRFAEVLDSPSVPALEDYFGRLGIELVEGQEAEVNLKALEWIREVASFLNRGLVFVVDYGYPARELFSPARPRGTLICYHRHQTSTDPYTRIGLQDMTAHLDFTSLAIQSREVGLELTGFTNQQYLMMGLGIAQEMERRLAECRDPSEWENRLRRMKHLIAGDGLGRVFQVLILHKGMSSPRLSGLTYRPYPEDALFL